MSLGETLLLKMKRLKQAESIAYDNMKMKDNIGENQEVNVRKEQRK